MMCKSPDKGLEVGGWEGQGIEVVPPGQWQDLPPDRFCRAGRGLPFSSKNHFDFGPFKKVRTGADPAAGKSMVLGWFASKFPIPSSFCLVGAKGSWEGAALVHMSLGSCSPDS